GVVVDKARRDDPPFGIDRAFCRCTGVFADPDDLAVLDRDIRGKCRLARAVDNAPVLNEQIVCHFFPPRCLRSLRASWPSQWVTAERTPTGRPGLRVDARYPSRQVPAINLMLQRRANLMRISHPNNETRAYTDCLSDRQSTEPVQRAWPPSI